MKKINYYAKLVAYDMDKPEQVKVVAEWMIKQAESMLNEMKEMTDGKSSGFAKRFIARLMK